MGRPGAGGRGVGWEGAGVNVTLLSGCWALATTSNMVLVSVSALTGYMLAEDKSLATLPIALQWMGTAGATMPAALLMRHLGRRPVFILGAAIGVTGAATVMYAIYVGSFALLCLGIALLGANNGFNTHYRFAAADAVPEERRSRAISLVLAGGLGAAVLGPLLARASKDLLAPYTFMGVFATLIVLALLVALLVSFVRLPKPAIADLAAPGRPLSEIVRQPLFLVAAAGAAVAYGVMVMLMSVTPLAMAACALPFSDATVVIQWHIVGMFAPAFFTGHLIRRIGVLEVMLVGAALTLACTVVAMSGISFVHFWLAQTLLGLGWNFLFIGATTLLTQVHTIAERAKTQGFNDLLVFGTVGIGTFSSGNLLHHFDWATLNLVALVPVLLVAAGTLWLLVRRRRRLAPAE